MADNGNEYVYKIVGDTADLEEKLDKAEKKVSWVQSKAASAGAAFANMGRKLSGVFAEVAKQSAIPDDLKNMRDLSRIPDELGQLWDGLTKKAGYFSEEASEARDRIAEIKEEMAALSNTPQFSDTFQELQTQAEKADQTLEKLYSKMDRADATGVNKSSVAYKGLQYDIQAAEGESERLHRSMERMQANGSAFVPAVDTTQYQRLNAELEQTQSRLSEVSNTGQSGFGSMGSAIAGFGSRLAGFGSKLSGLFGRGISGGIKLFTNGIKGAVNWVKKLGKQSTSSGGMVKKLTKSLTSMATLLKSRLKRALVSAIFSDMQANFGQMAQISPQFNAAVSGVIDSSKQLGAQLIAIVEPVANIVLPIVSQLMDKLTAGAAAMAQFVARATGNDTFIKASKGQSNYAASVDKTASSTKKATDAAKKYHNTVLGFDQLNKMNGTDDAETDEVGIDPAKLEQAKVEASALSELGDRLFEAWKNKDWYGVGAGLADGVAMAAVKMQELFGWSKNADKFTAFFQGLTDGVNGFIDSWDSQTIGTAVGDCVNTVIESFAVLLDPNTGLHFGELGGKIGDTLTATIRTIHWDTLTADLVNGIQGILDFCTGFLNSDFGESLGEAVRKAFEGAFEAFDISHILDIVKGLWHTLTGFVRGLIGDHKQFDDIGSKIAENVNNMVKNFNVSEFMGTLHDVCGKILSGVIDFLSTSLVEIIDFILTFDWWGAFTKVGELVSDTLLSILTLVVNAIGEFVTGTFNKLYNKFDGFKNWANGVASWFGGGDPRSYSGAPDTSSIGHFARGGVVGDGQLFIANEGGRAELIGADDNGNTAVVNNQQIISAVVSGVRQAVTEAILTTGGMGGDNSGGDAGDIVLIVDSEELARASLRGQKRIDKRTQSQVSFA